MLLFYLDPEVVFHVNGVTLNSSLSLSIIIYMTYFELRAKGLWINAYTCTAVFLSIVDYRVERRIKQRNKYGSFCVIYCPYRIAI
jgi:hypothetical protein